MITLKQMSYFEALARTRHFGKAAEIVHISQPALSSQIAEMESRLKCRLFERQRGDVRLTVHGERLLPRIRQILEQVESLAELAAPDVGFLDGRLRLGIIPTIAPYLLPSLVPSLRKSYPDLALELRESTTDTLVEAVQAREIDAFVAALPIEVPGIASRALFRDRFFMACSRNSDTVLVGPVKPENVEVEKLLLLTEGHCLRDQALQICDRGQGPARRIVNYGATSMATLVQMVSGGFGMTLIPEIAIAFENRDGSMQIAPFAKPEPFRTVALFWRASREKADQFLALAEAIGTTASGLVHSGE